MFTACPASCQCSGGLFPSNTLSVGVPSLLSAVRPVLWTRTGLPSQWTFSQSWASTHLGASPVLTLQQSGQCQMPVQGLGPDPYSMTQQDTLPTAVLPPEHTVPTGCFGLFIYLARIC